MSLSKIWRVAALVFGLFLCGNAFAQHVDTSTYAILPYTTQMDWIFPRAKAATLSSTELVLANNLLKKCIADHNIKQRKRFEEIKKIHPYTQLTNFIINLNDYKRQYVCVVNVKKERIVWVNCFCNVPDHWRRSIVQVFDGGICYFNLKINLTKRKCFDLMVNGDA